MITVTIAINGQPIFTRSAVRVITGEDGAPNTYHVDTGEVIRHHGQDGAVRLAEILLSTIREPGRKGGKRRER